MRPFWLALAAALACLGCGQHLLGTHDVELDYTIEGAEERADVARGAVVARLAAARLTADVDLEPPRTLRVSVDDASVEAVDEQLEWRGGIRIYRFDPSFVFTPKLEEGLTPRTELVDGRVERYYSGDADPVFRAVRATEVDAAHRVVVDADANGKARTRAVAEPPLADLSGSVVRIETVRGKTLALHLTQGALGALGELSTRFSGEALAVVRNRSVVATARLDRSLAGDALLVNVGRDLGAWARAQRLRRLLESPNIPRLVRASVAREPPNWALAGASLALPLLLSVAWLFFVRRFDRARPEPMWLLAATFALGAASAPLAGLVEWVLASASPYLNTAVMTLGGQLVATPIAFVVFTLTVGLSEEGAKLLGATALAARRREFDEPVDGIVYAAASALGFAAAENVEYFAQGRLGGALIVSRAFMTVPAHVLFSSIWGYALGRKLVAPRTRVALYYLAAAAAHGAFDTLLSVEGLALLAGVLNLALASLFIVLLRRALRHGVVTPEAARVPPETRSLFPVGSRALFAFFAATLHLVAALLFGVGIYAQERSWRVGLSFVVVSAALASVFVLVAYGLTESLPLDVVLDDYGVTFGGAAVPWHDVVAFARRRSTSPGRGEEIHLRLRQGGLMLGPGSAGVMDRLAAALGRRLGAT